MNVKQAAQFLNVSEISIRRWTDAGRLSCMRIGGRRERRFRQQDLAEFLEIQSGTRRATAGIGGADTANSKNLLLEGVAIDYGNHLCSLYETDVGRVKLSVPFLADGLRAGDRCFLVASRPTQEIILHDLAEICPDTGAAIDDSRLVVSEGESTSGDLYDYFERQFLESTRRGSQCMRVVGDMAWALDKGISVDDLMDFEMRYNHALAKKFPVVSLCQYDARKFSGTAIVSALKSHKDTFKFPLSRFVGY